MQNAQIGVEPPTRLNPGPVYQNLSTLIYIYYMAQYIRTLGHLLYFWKRFEQPEAEDIEKEN